MAFVLTAGASASAQEQTKRILVLNPNTVEQPATAILNGAASRRLAQALPGRIEVYTEFLDLSRFPEKAHEQRFVTFLAEKYATVAFDAIVSVGPEALRFVIDHRVRIERGTPLVFCCTSPPTLAGIELPHGASGIVTEYDLARTLDLAALLQPMARDVVIVAGASAFDRQWAATAKRQLASYEPRYRIDYLVGLPLAQLLDSLRSLPRNTIVILTSIFSDGAGRTFRAPRELVPEIAATSGAPIYAPYDTFLGQGIVGGYMDTFEASGIALADLTLRVLAGERSSVQSGVGSVFRVDWRQLQRWGMSETNLPADTTLLFREPSLWDQYWHLSIIAVAMFALQTAVVLYLLIERHRRLRAERSLTDSEERMAFAAAAVNVGLWQYDIAVDRMWATDHCRAMFGISPTAPLTREAFVARVHQDDIAAARKWAHDASQSSSPRVGEFRVLPENGEVRWYLARGMTRFDDKGSPVRISGAFSDITARKTAEAEVETQRQTLAHITRVSTLGELSGAIAHELNQPLTAILANAEAARRMLSHPQPPLHLIADALDDIIKEDSRADDVIMRMRGMLKRDRQRLERMDLNALVESMLKLLHSELVDRRISVDLDLAADLPIASGDPIQIQQVITNLVMNAMDAAMSPGAARRSITIATTSRQPGHVETAVTDNGPGLTPEAQVRVLEPFYTTKQHGLGLGLAICNSIVKAHGGVLSIANDARGGVRASFALPTNPAV